MAKRRYTDAERAEALALLDANGGNLFRTAKQTSIPRTTLETWRDGRVSADVPKMRDENRQSLSERFLDEIYANLNLMPSKRDEASYKDLATVVGIFTDKHELLTGKPTERFTLSTEKLTDDQLARIASGGS